MPFGVCECIVLVLWLSNGTKTTTPPLFMKEFGDPMYDDNSEERVVRIAGSAEPHGLVCAMRDNGDTAFELVSCYAHVGDFVMELGRELSVRCPRDESTWRHVTDRIVPRLAPEIKGWLHLSNCSARSVSEEALFLESS